MSLHLHLELSEVVFIFKGDETVIQFTNRVKSEIARKGGLVDLDW